MKYIVFILFAIVNCNVIGQNLTIKKDTTVFKQDTSNNTKLQNKKIAGAIINFGISAIFINNHDFNAWTLSHYHKQIKSNTAGFCFNIGAYGNKYGGGVSLQSNSLLQMGTIYVSRVIIRTKNYRSLISINFGFVNSFIKGIVPPNYVLTSNQIGKSLELRYSNYCFQIASNNIFRIFNVFANPAIYRKPSPFSFSLDVKFSYMPQTWGHWNYGYDPGYRKPWSGNRIGGIPSLDSFCFSVALSIGLF